MLLGVTLFSTNYLLFCEAEKFVLSGNVAIIFSLLVVFNILNGRRRDELKEACLLDNLSSLKSHYLGSVDVRVLKDRGKN